MSRACIAKHKQSSRTLLAGLLAALMVLAVGCGGGAETASQDNAAVPVVVETAAPREVARHVTFSGKIEPKDEVNIVAELSAQVLEIPVQVGQWVEAGTTLVKLDATAVRQELSQAEAAVRIAQAALEDARQAYESAKRQHERMAPLYELGAVSEQDWEQVEDTLKRAQLAAEVQVPGQLQQAEAALASAQYHLDKTTLKAPIAGEVAGVFTSPGNLVAPGNPVLTLVDRNVVEVSGILTDRQIVHVSPGLNVTINVGALPDRTFQGAVHSVAPAANAQLGGFPVTVRLPNDDGQLRPGMVAEVRIPVEQATGSLAIRSDAVIQRDGKSTVFVVENGHAVEREVSTGIGDDTYVVVTRGLTAGDQVVISGQHFLTDGAAVEVIQDPHSHDPNSQGKTS